MFETRKLNGAFERFPKNVVDDFQTSRNMEICSSLK